MLCFGVRHSYSHGIKLFPRHSLFNLNNSNNSTIAVRVARARRSLTTLRRRSPYVRPTVHPDLLGCSSAVHTEDFESSKEIQEKVLLSLSFRRLASSIQLMRYLLSRGSSHTRRERNVQKFPTWRRHVYFRQTASKGKVICAVCDFTE